MPFTPLTTLKIGELLRDVFPPGVVNIVSGSDELGAWMTSHPIPRKISFTGSVETGKKVAMAAAPDLKRVTLELGGNDPAIVLDDADPAVVSSAIFAGAFMNNGQVCSAVKRVYVPEALYDDVVEGLAAHGPSIKVGEGNEEDVKLGPINNEPQYERVKELVADAICHGATAVTGGKAMDRPATSSSRRSSPGSPTARGSSTRSSSARRSPSSRTATWATPSTGPTRRTSACRARCGEPTRQGGRGRCPARVRHRVGEHAPGARSAPAVRRLQVERHRRGERAVGPCGVLRVPGRVPQKG